MMAYVESCYDYATYSYDVHDGRPIADTPPGQYWTQYPGTACCAQIFDIHEWVLPDLAIISDRAKANYVYDVATYSYDPSGGMLEEHLERMLLLVAYYLHQMFMDLRKRSSAAAALYRKLAIPYHKPAKPHTITVLLYRDHARKAIVCGILWFLNIEEKANPADVLSKHCGHVNRVGPYLKWLLLWQGAPPLEGEVILRKKGEPKV